MNDALRVELEGAYRPLDVDGAKGVLLNSAPVDVGLSGELDTWSLMVNAHYEMSLGAARPYLGAGLGVARHDGELTLSSPLLVSVLGTNSVRESGDDTVFAYQFMAGLGFEVSDNVTLFGGYRYMGTDDMEIEAFTASYGTHAIEAGLRVGSERRVSRGAQRNARPAPRVKRRRGPVSRAAAHRIERFDASECRR